VFEKNLSRREFLRKAAVTGAGLALAGCAPKVVKETVVVEKEVEKTVEKVVTATPAMIEPTEVLHWNWLSASDAEVWQSVIDDFNDANENTQIRMELVPDAEWATKVMPAVAAGVGPDFGWAAPAAGLEPDFVDKGILVPLDDLAHDVGLDMDDFAEGPLNVCRYAAFDNKLYGIPLDVMTMALEINADHAQEAGLDIENPPQTGEELLEWADAMTVREGDKVVRSGMLMGPSIQNTVVWGIVSGQMGYKRVSDDLKTACVNPEAGKEAMQWIYDLYEKHKVSTLEVTDRYKAFGVGQGSMFITGPWTVSGYLEAGVNYISIHVPKIGKEQKTYLEVGSLGLYTQPDTSRYATTMQAVKWLSDNSFKWTTEGRGAAARKSVLSRADYQTSGLPWAQRGAFVDEKALEMATIPIGYGLTEGGFDFIIYAGENYLAQTLDSVWYGEKSIDEAMDLICQKYQEHLDAAA